MKEEKLAIRFGLGAIKAVGFGMMETAVKERETNGKFQDLYDFSQRLDPRNINKKSIEALAKAGAFDSINDNRRQIAESFDILSSYASSKKEEATSNQMSLFGDMPELNKKPELKKISNWDKAERLQKEFEAFGFFLNEHPVDDKISDLKKRGVIFSEKLEKDELQDGNLVKMAGIVASSKHRSGGRGRFAYLNISDPFGIFEAMIFDEALITSARDILTDGSMIMLECLIRKDDGGTRILVRDVKKLDDFINSTKAANNDFEDIKKQVVRNYNRPKQQENKPAEGNNNPTPIAIVPIQKKTFTKVEIIIKNRNPLFTIKSLLENCLAKEGENKTRVILSVMQDGKVMKVELPDKYCLDEVSILRLKTINDVIDVEII